MFNDELQKRHYQIVIENHICTSVDGCTLSSIEFCEHCIFDKHRRVKLNTSVHTTKGTLDYVHADLWGSSRKPSYGDAHYMLNIIHDSLEKCGLIS